MKRFITAVGAAALVGLMAVPAMAQDVASATCGDYMGADDGTRLQWLGAMRVYAADAKNAATTAELQATIADRTDADLDQRIKMGCDGKEASLVILDLLKMN